MEIVNETVIKPVGVVLSLSLKEAAGLLALTGQVHGLGPLRDVSDSIYRGLVGANIPEINDARHDFTKTVQSALRLRD